MQVFTGTGLGLRPKRPVELGDEVILVSESWSTFQVMFRDKSHKLPPTFVAIRQESRKLNGLIADRSEKTWNSKNLENSLKWSPMGLKFLVSSPLEWATWEGDVFCVLKTMGPLSVDYMFSWLCTINWVKKKKSVFSEVVEMENEDGEDGLEKAEPTVFSGFVGTVDWIGWNGRW